MQEVRCSDFLISLGCVSVAADMDMVAVVV